MRFPVRFIGLADEPADDDDLRLRKRVMVIDEFRAGRSGAVVRGIIGDRSTGSDR